MLDGTKEESPFAKTVSLSKDCITLSTWYLKFQRFWYVCEWQLPESAPIERRSGSLSDAGTCWKAITLANKR